DDDEELREATALLGAVVPASQIRHDGVEQAASKILDVADRTGLDGYWVHLDVDILDPSVMPAVDSPDPGGLSAAELTELLAALARRPPSSLPPTPPPGPPPPPPPPPPTPPPPPPPPPRPPPVGPPRRPYTPPSAGGAPPRAPATEGRAGPRPPQRTRTGQPT